MHTAITALQAEQTISWAWPSVKKQTPVSTSLPPAMGPAVPPTLGRGSVRLQQAVQTLASPVRAAA